MMVQQISFIYQFDQITVLFIIDCLFTESPLCFIVYTKTYFLY